jgi:hypothetical protein
VVPPRLISVFSMIGVIETASQFQLPRRSVGSHTIASGRVARLHRPWRAITSMIVMTTLRPSIV